MGDKGRAAEGTWSHVLPCAPVLLLAFPRQHHAMLHRPQPQHLGVPPGGGRTLLPASCCCSPPTGRGSLEAGVMLPVDVHLPVRTSLLYPCPRWLPSRAHFPLAWLPEQVMLLNFFLL